MGNLVSGFHKPSILLSSDHKAMASYFSSGFNSIPVLSLNNILLDMNLGLFIIPIRFKNTKSYPFDYLDFCIKAENHGFSEVYIGEHITDDKEDIRSSMLFASALASRTKKLKICLSVLPLPHYNIRSTFILN